MIEVKNVTKQFEKKITPKEKVKFLADENITIEVKTGEIVGLLGPNGAGKTTLLRMISGILTPTEGSITIDDLNYKQDEIKIKSQIAFLSGNTKLYKDLSCYELLMLCAEIYGIPKEQAEIKIKELSLEFNLTDFLYSRIENLSTGQMQRVNIARCIIHDPKYYIFDEATSGLDIISSKVILDFIKAEKKKGKGIIYSTHYMEEAENICDRVILVHKGHIIMEGTPEQIEKKTSTSNLRDAFFKLIEGENHE